MLQPIRRAEQERTLAKELPLQYHPKDLDHDGESYYLKLVQRENQVFNATVARLMGNFIFGSTMVPIQTKAALDACIGREGTFYTLGSDVHALFFDPKEGYSTPDPTTALKTWLNHLEKANTPLPIGYSTMYKSFAEVVESRKEGLQGAWFNIPGESPLEAFMRRLKKDDPCYEIYEEYAEEFNARWGAKESISKDKAQELIGEIERLHGLECAEFDEQTAHIANWIV
jgi:hypothetical protein